MVTAFLSEGNFEQQCLDPNTNTQHNWRVMKCSREGYATMCVDCDDGCGTCMGGIEIENAWLINPCRTSCINNNNPTGSYAILKLDIELYIIISRAS